MKYFIFLTVLALASCDDPAIYEGLCFPIEVGSYDILGYRTEYEWSERFVTETRIGGVYPVPYSVQWFYELDSDDRILRKSQYPMSITYEWDGYEVTVTSIQETTGIIFFSTTNTVILDEKGRLIFHATPSPDGTTIHVSKFEWIDIDTVRIVRIWNDARPNTVHTFPITWDGDDCENYSTFMFLGF